MWWWPTACCLWAGGDRQRKRSDRRMEIPPEVWGPREVGTGEIKECTDTFAMSCCPAPFARMTLKTVWTDLDLLISQYARPGL